MRNIQRLLVLILVFVAAVQAQNVEVNRANRTITVTATETVRVEPDLAIVDVGYRNSAKTKDEAFEENVRVANRITKALLDAGIPKENIQTESIRLMRGESEWEQETSKSQVFTARQSWKIRVAAQDAQKVVDLAVKEGANQIEDVEWSVADPQDLEARAAAAALGKARIAADGLAKGFGVKAGALLYVSNMQLPRFGGAAYAVGRVPMARLAAPPKVALFPKNVEKEANVTAVFALD